MLCCLTNDRSQTEVAKRPFHGFFFPTFDTDKFGKISQLRCEDRLQISRVATFEIDLLKTKEELASRIRDILQRFVWWGQVCAPTIQTTVKFRNSSELPLSSLA